jgi:sigma-B regulation protein RsbU (phosphoserine phosphatase)
MSRDLLRFGHEFTAGLSKHDLERMFGEDAEHAITVLAGKRTASDDPWENFKYFLLYVKAFFLGLIFKLSPARRLLFAASVLLPWAGLFPIDTGRGNSRYDLYIDFSPLFFLLSICGLVWLLTLELVDRLRVRDELDVARELQSELLPQEIPRIPGYSIAHSYRTANEIGGDYYDFLPLGDGKIALAVGDASGHGIGAGLLMAISSASLKTAIDLDPAPEAVLESMNRTLARSGGRRAFMTLFYAILDPKSGELEYASAAHPFPFLRRASGEILELGSGALPLGLKRSGRYTSGRTRLEVGDLLLLYSDGLPEAVGGPSGVPEDAFGFERLKGLLSLSGKAQTVHDRILSDVDRHLGRRSLDDDLTLVVLCHDDDVHLPPLPSP